MRLGCKWRVKIKIVLFLFLLILILVQVERKIMPIAAAMARIEAQNIAGEMIDSAVAQVMEDMGLKAQDLFISVPQGEGTIFSADTMQINKFCAEVSNRLISSAKKLSSDKIRIPVGSTTGISLLANRGPDISFILKNAGTAEVNYETKFTSAGINQTNLQIWLEVSVTIQVVNPLMQDKLVLKRSIILVNTFLSGQVPEKYFQLSY